jgi:hypothetical protein
MLEPRMELSDNFRYVIENMPCCEQDDLDIAEYVNTFVFGYFGFTYVNTILLGGVAQQTIFINREAKQRLEQKQINIAKEAQVSFSKAMKYAIDGSTSTINSPASASYNSFMSEVQSSSSATLGGATYLTTLAEWSKTVVQNPIITQFEIRDIFPLLTRHHFPNDPLITNKSKLIEKMLESTVITIVGVMVLEELVNQLDILSLVFVNVSRDGLVLVVKQKNLRKYCMVLYVDLIVHLCELIAMVYVHGTDVRTVGLEKTG